MPLCMKHSMFANAFGYAEEFSIDDYNIQSLEEIRRLLKKGYSDRMQVTEHILFLKAIMDTTKSQFVMEQSRKLYDELVKLKN